MQSFKILLEKIGVSNHKVNYNYDYDFGHGNLDKVYKAHARIHDSSKILSPEEKETLQVYIGTGHYDINRFHRTGKVYPASQGGYNRKEIKEHTSNLDNIISSHQTKQNATVWRGIQPNVAKGMKLKPGTILHDKGFVSTSLNPSTAGSFGYQSGETHVFRIHLPKGSNAFRPLNHNIGKTREHEVILPRNSKFRYEDGHLHKDKWGSPFYVHHLTYLGQHHEE
jgi:hypothetical protein